MSEGNKVLVEHLISRGILKTLRIIEAFENVDRQDFVLDENKDDPYDDHPLSIGHGVTISQPYTVAFMLELLQPEKNEKILDVGAGSGWTIALLAHIVGGKGQVAGTEIIPEIVGFGQKNLGKYNLENAEITQAQNEVLGLPKKGPYNKILVSAAAEKLPEELIRQLKIGGILVIPIQNSIWKITKISETELKEEEHKGFVFVPLK